MSLIKQIDFKSLGDDRGGLVSLENNKEIPFDVKRVYYIFNTKENVSRGFHAHKALKQVAVCVAGSCTILLNDGKNKGTVFLDSPTKGIIINDLVWHEMHDFSDDCVFLVLASELYDEEDYIRDYDQFLKFINNDS